jgi:hypothetical protein
MMADGKSRRCRQSTRPTLTANARAPSLFAGVPRIRAQSADRTRRTLHLADDWDACGDTSEPAGACFGGLNLTGPALLYASRSFETSRGSALWHLPRKPRAGPAAHGGPINRVESPSQARPYVPPRSPHLAECRSGLRGEIPTSPRKTITGTLCRVIRAVC